MNLALKIKWQCKPSQRNHWCRSSAILTWQTPSGIKNKYAWKELMPRVRLEIFSYYNRNQESIICIVTIDDSYKTYKDNAYVNVGEDYYYAVNPIHCSDLENSKLD